MITIYYINEVEWFFNENILTNHFFSFYYSKSERGCAISFFILSILIFLCICFFQFYAWGTTFCTNITKRTICPRSSYSFYVVPYCIKWVTTSWTDRINVSQTTNVNLGFGIWFSTCLSPSLGSVNATNSQSRWKMHYCCALKFATISQKIHT